MQNVKAQRQTATLWRPHPDNKPQCAAYVCEAQQLLYGGAAGGGKSDLLIGLARTKHQKSLLLRRTFPDLERSLITRSLEVYGDPKLYNASKHVWHIGSRRIEFGHMEQVGTPQVPKDEGDYASAAYDLIGIDQAEQFPEYAFDFLGSRNRTTKAGQPVRLVLSANPVGEGVEWLMRRWAPWLDETYPHPARPGELRWFKRMDDGREIETSADDPDAVSRTFIPAGLKDNPYLGDDYRRQLALLPEPLRSALLNGDWKASITDDAYQVIPRAWIKAAQARWRPDGAKVRLSALGLDVARGGDDKEVLSPRYGNWFGELVKITGAQVPDGPRAARPVLEFLERIGEAVRTGRDISYHDAGFSMPVMKSSATVQTDVIGVGSSAHDTLRTHGINSTPINWSEHSEAIDKSGKLKFTNKRAEHWWKMRETLDPSNHKHDDGSPFDESEKPALPPDPELLGDLCAPRWSMQTNGIKIESKEDIKKRLGRSPDCGDGAVLANAGDVSVDEWIAFYKRQAENTPEGTPLSPSAPLPALPAGIQRAPQWTPPLPPRW